MAVRGLRPGVRALLVALADTAGRTARTNLMLRNIAGRVRTDVGVDLLGGTVMRRVLSAGLVLSLGACALSDPSGQRYVVFFRESSAQMDDLAKAVLVGAADWAKKHSDMPVTVASYADPYGSQKANADFTRLRAQVVVDGLVANGVLASRIQRREIGPVNFTLDAQESRRVEITVGSP